MKKIDNFLNQIFLYCEIESKIIQAEYIEFLKEMEEGGNFVILEPKKLEKMMKKALVLM